MKPIFKVGDIIRVIDKIDGLSLRGWIGKVIHFKRDSNDIEDCYIGIEFEQPLERDGHNCDGYGKEGYCRYAYENEIVKL
jgi:hypothetical protein